MIYLDNAATTPVRPEVIEAMLPYFNQFYGNPSNLYSLALRSRRALDEARATVAKAIGARGPEEIVFTGCGTEADNLAVLGLARARQNLGRHIITSTIEHHAVLYACGELRREGFQVTKLAVDRYGLVDPQELAAALRPDTILVSIMAANNEVGTIQPLRQLAQVVAGHQAYFHTDAVQATGAIPLKVEEWGIDALSLSAHKFYGPKGVGALYLRQGVKPWSVNYGGGQERGLRSGTENVPGIIGLAKALELATQGLEERLEPWRAKRDFLKEKLLAALPEAQLTGHPQERLPGSVSLVIPRLEGESLLILLDRQGICASGGAACSAGHGGISHVLAAMGVGPELGRGSLRLTLAPDIEYELLEEAAEKIAAAVQKLWKVNAISARSHRSGRRRGER